MLKQTVGAPAVIALIVLVVAAVAGIGYYYVKSAGRGAANPLPPAHSRIEMLQNLRARGIHAGGAGAERGSR